MSTSLALFAIILTSPLVSSISALVLQKNAKSDAGLTTVQMIKKYGYTCETHYITTEDGYILTFHRIPSGGTPVVVIHGLMSSSADFVNSGPDRSLGFFLSKLGYDVWLGNTRGNLWSRNHTSLDPVRDARTFWDFSWHEIGIFDLPAAIDYVLSETGVKKVQYIGHSQGSTAFLVMTSVKAEYNTKIALASLMAPPAFMEHVTRLSRIVRHLPKIIRFLNLFRIWEYPLTNMARRFGQKYCGRKRYIKMCANLIFAFDKSADKEQLDLSLLPVYLTSVPAGSSMKDYYHYAQLIISGGFLQYNYGLVKNLIRYRSTKPPPYDLTKITAPVAIYYGRKDSLAVLEDVEHLVEVLPNVVNAYLVPFDKFNHLDFVIAKDVVTLLYDNMTATMANF